MEGRYTANPHLAEMPSDHLFHLKISTGSMNFQQEFSDVKFVCVGGSPVRLTSYAEYIRSNLVDLYPHLANQKLENITGGMDRYVLYKVGPVLVASHGIGVPSMSVLMHEIFKLLYHAGCKEVKIFRLGTSGGLGVEPGTIVVSNGAVNPEGKEIFEQFICGKKRVRETKLDKELVQDILDKTSNDDDKFEIKSGKTMCGDDFYEAQGRLDGAICDYTLQDKMEFLERLHKQQVVNIEMECTAFAALTSTVGIKGAIICVTILDRLKGDQVNTGHDELKKIENRPVEIFTRYVRKCLADINMNPSS